MSTFRKYLCLEVFIWIYLGCWNATVPLIIVQRGSLLELATYETGLALTAVVSVLFLASRVETMRRGTAIKAGCIVILLTGILRYVSVAVSYSIEALMIIDMLAVSAFGVIQSLFGVYPAETVEKHRMERAFRVRRIIITISRVIGPLLAGVVIGIFSPLASLLFSALVGMGALALALTLPLGVEPDRQRVKSPVERVQDIFLGIKLKLILPPERFLTVSGFLLFLTVTATVPMLVPNQIHAHGLAQSSVGLFNAVFAAGAVAGLFLLSPLIAKRKHQRIKYIVLWTVLTVSLCTSALSTEIWQLASSLIVAGASSACLSLVGMDKRTVSVPSGVRIRLMAATLIVSQLANSASYMLVGSAITLFGIGGLLWVYLIIFMIVLLYCALSNSVWDFLEDTKDAEFYYKEHHPKLESVMRT
ncbi:MFS transporter [Pseudomonas fluorescens]|uniref:MFS transporter n=1 Tax=Pseudomonas fluorescens TaxID=294 RepID=UPI001131C606|nr:MFS transporter [Pseudomonas fluorescens]TMU76864.1 MFS transporter [Pseudomonas fluorescens]